MHVSIILYNFIIKEKISDAINNCYHAGIQHLSKIPGSGPAKAEPDPEGFKRVQTPYFQ